MTEFHPYQTEETLEYIIEQLRKAEDTAVDSSVPEIIPSLLEAIADAVEARARDPLFSFLENIKGILSEEAEGEVAHFNEKNLRGSLIAKCLHRATNDAYGTMDVLATVLDNLVWILLAADENQLSRVCQLLEPHLKEFRSSLYEDSPC